MQDTVHRAKAHNSNRELGYTVTDNPRCDTRVQQRMDTYRFSYTLSNDIKIINMWRDTNTKEPLPGEKTAWLRQSGKAWMLSILNATIQTWMYCSSLTSAAII